MKLSIIIPVLNEAECVKECLDELQSLRQAKHEVIVVDGGSIDETVAIAAPMCDKLIISEKGRGRQMNAGAGIAEGEMYVFLHADTVMTFDLENVLNNIENSNVWGCFDVHLSGNNLLFRIYEFFINLRSRLTGIATGDQVMFVSKGLFKQAGGFPEIPLMEDIALSKKLKRICRPVCYKEKVITSSRRWEEFGILRTMFKMWSLRFRFAIGVDPVVLAKEYE